MTSSHSGGCHCGHIRYQFSGPLHDIAHCHGLICRKVSGGIVSTWITVAAASFQWLSGTPSRLTRRAVARGISVRVVARN